jgi:hypothetical protein
MMMLMIMMMMVKMAVRLLIGMLIQRPSGQVQRQYKYKDRTKTIEEDSKDRTKIKKDLRYQGAKIPGARSLWRVNFIGCA